MEVEKKMDNLKNNFSKNSRKIGISLIVLIITIIVMIILSASIMLSVSKTNVVSEAIDARRINDLSEVQGLTSLTIASISNKYLCNVEIIPGIIKDGIEFRLINPKLGNVSAGKIGINDTLENVEGEDNSFSLGIDLPIYVSNETTWYIDVNGIITLKVKDKIYGNGDRFPKIADIYEEFAGDEYGAIEGKVHIGDYINYNPIPSGVTEKTVDNGLKYVSGNDATGITRALENGYDTSVLANVTNQTFTTQENLKWKVLGISGENILITLENTLIPDVPVEKGSSKGYYMYGANSYEYGIDELNNICSIYGKGDLAQSACGMTIKDVDKITGVTIEESGIKPSGVDRWNIYGSSYSYEAGSSLGWGPSDWINKTDGQTSPGISGISDGYYYFLYNSNLITSNTNSIKYKLLYNGYSYWLASRSVVSNSGRGRFGLGGVYNGRVFTCSDAYLSTGAEHDYIIGVRPVVTLKANVTAVQVSIDSNGVATWNIFEI